MVWIAVQEGEAEPFCAWPGVRVEAGGGAGDSRMRGEAQNFVGGAEAELLGLPVAGADGGLDVAAMLGFVVIAGAAKGGAGPVDVDGQWIVNEPRLGEFGRQLFGELLLGFGNLFGPAGDLDQPVRRRACPEIHR